MELTKTDEVPTKAKRELTKKEELNNLIVSMRKSVQQAKVHTINKLTKEVKRLKERKGDEKVVIKSIRKAERLLEEINTIKHLKKDEVSIFALQAKKSLTEYLQEIDTTTKTKALARLSYHRSLQTEVTKYRQQNPHWALQIPVLLEKSKDKQKRLLKKEKLNVEDKDKEDDKSLDLESEVVKSKSVKEVKKSTKRKNTTPQLDKVEGTIKVKVLKDLSELEEEKETNKKQASEEVFGSDDEPLPQRKRPRSSFFIGGVDEVKEKEEPEQIERPRQKELRNFESKPVYRKGKLVSKSKPKSTFSDRKKEKPARTPRYFDKSSDKNFSSSNLKVKTPTLAKTKPAVASTEKLHPSWEAKKRQAPLLTSFQGRKTVFGDDD